MLASAVPSCREYDQSRSAVRQHRATECLNHHAVEYVSVSHASNISEREMKHLGGLSGRTFPNCEEPLKERDVAKQVASALVVDFAHYRSHHKVIARIAGASPKSAENWLAGDHPPSLVYFLRLLPHSPSLRKLVAMESELSPDFTRELSQLIQRHLRG